MQRHMLKSKIHRATITGANVDYIGSITIDSELMERADILENEKVHVVNVDNGVRLETYAIPGEPGSGVICLNGAAARLMNPGELIIILAYAVLTEDELKGFKPRIVFVDENNRPFQTQSLQEEIQNKA
ncbi:MAG: aspartate 1-decarboxylase [Candidatus Aquicultor secundus]|uniref:Aspartate 1-decarboxylase n=1 Tax=Candidatus Aquicultor secundus TaxID=1973895 RepID=A0A2M7T6M0_9ACTN|nr:aspartate 1-decarboxylase [Candidatus Aquicultor secundus]NCO66627.1 aspartate 1-decarboxylase [Solirubrobacter sp.]OIO83592.1 MAG: aspartate 1-decarboxylase [Candidatus Aquicultor secundus]PIU26033.1 MAG: aspartate 1-decarboxylase [Candidatus Aquicultor secundus]PIW22597.1 MAG: aspartate 1-decarboxylase [Candidatus Aquicultor secundus]PIX51249.1 MAG: aspartate 1-decarboxylase [Candidatus Aquicultor secundus]